MRLITREEHALLVNSALPVDGGVSSLGRAATAQELATFARLIEQGRVRDVVCEHEGERFRVAEITPAGREALRLWPILVERGLVVP